jgi:hypothetical protein
MNSIDFVLMIAVVAEREDGRVSPLPSLELIRRALSAGRTDAAIIVTEPHE